MNKVHIDFENCYGIKKLKADFDFSNKSTYAIYSPNGTMKTSFAKTFMDLSVGKDSQDLIFVERATTRCIQDESGNELLPDNILVIEPYNESYKSSKLSTLLVNKELKEKYDAIHANISDKKDILLKELKSLTGFRKEIEEAFSMAFTHSPKEFYKALMRVKSEVLDSEAPEFSEIVYKNIFTDKIISFLGTKDFKDKLADYINKYDELIDSSTYFKKGVFNHNNAAVIAKNLKDNGFFEANHSVYLNSDGQKTEVKTQGELEEVIKQEKDAILNNPDLAKAFEEIDAKLKANQELRGFRDYLLSNLKILPELTNINGFEQKLWISYLKTSLESYVVLEKEYNDGKCELEGIIGEAKNEETEWRNVIDIFNKRFSVPFQLSVENQEDVILKSEGPSIKFTFVESSGSKQINESDLLRVLSNGEKRALYILNIIFEVEARKKNGQETLFIIDDIADSFDYKNKYAIIEYLKDISLITEFSQIILSHNFDFFRTVSSRLDMQREHKLHTFKSGDEIILKKEFYQNNPFMHWKNNLASNNLMLIASIPFVRNIAEFSGDTTTLDKLTDLLHVKASTETIAISDLESIYKAALKNQQSLSLPNHSKKVVELIFDEADLLATLNDEGIELESKIVFAIAIRLKAEQHMISKINDTSFVNSITSHQTYKLYKKYKELFADKLQELQVLDRVVLMTPENIHVNAFMYEPILDMSNTALTQLYNDIKNI